MAFIRSVIRGVGAHLPKRVMTNDDLSRLVDTSDSWIRERTGIVQRHIAEDVREVSSKTSETYAFYNNHYGAKAVVNALQLEIALGRPIPKPLPEPLVAAFADVLGEVASTT